MPMVYCWRLWEARIRRFLASVHMREGNSEAALGCFDEALRIHGDQERDLLEGKLAYLPQQLPEDEPWCAGLPCVRSLRQYMQRVGVQATLAQLIDVSVHPVRRATPRS